MENNNFGTSLTLKLTLLKTLKEGDINKSRQLLKQLAHTSHSHP